MADQLRREVAHAFRVLRRASGLSLLSIVTIGAGIGASALLFSLVHGVVLQPLPYPQPDRLVRIFDTNPRTGADRVGAASGNFNDWRTRAPHFDGIAGYYAMGRTITIAGYYAMGRTITIGGDSVVILTAQVSRGVFEVTAITAVAVIVAIALLGLAATVIPSWRAARIDPVVVLRRG